MYSSANLFILCGRAATHPSAFNANGGVGLLQGGDCGAACFMPKTTERKPKENQLTV